MNKGLFLPSLLLFTVFGNILPSLNYTDVRAASYTEEKPLVLYDAASGAIPSESLMDFTDFPPGAAPLDYANGVTAMDSTVSGMETYAGWVSGQAIIPGFPILDRTAGFQVKFTLQVESESHAKNNRAGFSVIILDKDAKGVELAFWENEIWAQNDDHTGRLFTHGEGAVFDPTADLINYQVTIVGDTYTLIANSKPILSGLVRDYSNFDGFPDPYETPNFIFLGDDTTVAGAQLRLQFVSVTGTEPVLPTSTTTETSTGNPLPIASLTSFPITTPVPSPIPTPVGNIFQLCSSGWVFLTLATTGVMMSNKIRRRYRKHS